MNRCRWLIALAVLLVGGMARGDYESGDDAGANGAASDVSYSGLVSGVQEKSDLEAVNSPENQGEQRCDERGCGNSFDCVKYCPVWDVKAGAIILQRGTPRSTPVLSTFNGIALVPQVNAHDFGFNGEAGPDIILMRAITGSRDTIELRFFGINGWSATQSFSGLGLVPTNPPIAVAFPTITYTSRLYSAEINCVETVNQWFNWLGGFRWMQVGEALDYSTLVGGDSVFNTNNNLYGGQLGTNLRVWDSGGPLRINTSFKLGLYGNSADNGLHSVDPTSVLLAADQRSQLAFVAEIGVTGVYQWTDHLALRAGYELLWIDGLALAPEQIAATNIPVAGVLGSGINSTGETFYQGALVGLELTW